MPHYNAPLRDMQFVLSELLEVEKAYKEMPDFAEVDMATIQAVLEEGSKFCTDILLPLNRVGDEEGCTHNKETNSVNVPKGFKQAYQQYVEGGWPALSCDPAYGGQGLPITVNQCMYEMMNSSNQAWTIYPGLSHGAYEALLANGTALQQAMYLPKLVNGQYTGTMCLTEPHCGTDLGLLRTKAQPQEDGTYLITGSKIFISSGDQDMSENIVHLVLARLPDAPAGIKGISLFAVPKFKVNANGELGERNPIYCTGIEHKMGMHGNATCQMTLENAQGTMVGEPNKGMAAMFVFMNTARLGVGNQSLGLTEVAYQNALAYAKERIQGRSLKGAVNKDQPADCILVHPDVRKMLLTAKAYAEGGRTLTLHAALLLDKEHHHPDPSVQKESAEMLAFLTPIVKAFITDNAWISTSHCLQVLGGHGYIREWGLEQFVRDSRINMIYEGTNTVQSLDLLGRKILANQGATLKKFGTWVQTLIEQESANEAMSEFITPLAKLAGQVEKVTMEIGFRAMQNSDEVGAASVDYLRLIGHLVYSYYFARMARIALKHLNEGETDTFYQAKIQTARFYFAKLLPETTGLMHSIGTGSRALMETQAVLV